MSLEEQLHNLKEKQLAIEKLIVEKKIKEKNLTKDASIERLEQLVKHWSEHLDHKSFNSNIPSKREELNSRYNSQLKSIKEQNIHYKNRNGFPVCLPVKDELLRNEEILVTIVNLLKKQDKIIKDLSSKVDIYKLTTNPFKMKQDETR